MFTGMDSLLAHQRRDELVREIDSGRLGRKLRAGRRLRRERRWAFWLPDVRAGGGGLEPREI